MTNMTAYLGWSRTTEVPVTPDDLGCGAGLVLCFECGGTGDRPYGPTPAECGPCVDCKGTGEVLISI